MGNVTLYAQRRTENGICYRSAMECFLAEPNNAAISGILIHNAAMLGIDSASIIFFQYSSNRTESRS